MPPKDHTVTTEKNDSGFHIHVPTRILQFLLALIIALVTLIVWLTDKPSQAQVEHTIDLKQAPVISRLDEIRNDLLGIHRDAADTRKDVREIHDYILRDGTAVHIPYSRSSH